MPVEVKQIIEHLGLKEDDVKDIDSFKKVFPTIFTRRDQVDDETKNSIVGGALGKITREARKIFKEVGEVEMSEKDIKDVNLEDVIKLGLTRFKEKTDAVANEYKTFKETAGDPTKEVAKWEKDYNKLKTQFEAKETEYNTVKTEFDTFKTSKDSEFKTYKLNSKKAEIHSKIKFPEKTPQLMIDGFNGNLDKKYKLEFDDTNNKLIVYDASTNKRIQGGKTAGTFKEYEDIINDELIKAELVVKNNHAGNQPPADRTRTPERAPLQQNNDMVQRRAPAPRIS